MGLSLIVAALTWVQAANENVDRRLKDADPAVSMHRFINYPAGARWDTFVHNPKFWAKGVDFSCASPWNSMSGTLRAGTLISKRHIIFADHFPLADGTRIVFVGEDGGVCPCYVEKTKRVEQTDMRIGLLNAEVTPNIRPAKILPEDFGKYLGEGVGLPVATFNQKEKLFLTEAVRIHSPTNGYPRRGIFSNVSKDEHRAKFREPLVKGDSGNPAFFLLGDQAVLACCLTSGRTGAGPAPHMWQKEIQAVMDELCPGYKLELFSDWERVNGLSGK